MDDVFYDLDEPELEFGTPLTEHMTKNPWKSSYFEDYIDDDKAQEQENNRTDVENKKIKIMKLMTELENDEGDLLAKSDTGSEIVKLVEDIHQQYESLYSLYTSLTGDLWRKVHHKEKTDETSSSSSDSESDHSSKVTDRENHNGESEFHKLTENLKRQLEATNRNLTAISEEKDALGVKILNTEKIVDGLRKTETELNQKLEFTYKEKDAITTEKATALMKLEEEQKVVDNLQRTTDQLKEENGSLKQEVENVKGEFRDLNQQLSSLNQALGAIKDENTALTSKNSLVLLEIEKAEEKIRELTDESKQLRESIGNRENELSGLLKKYADLESEASAERKNFDAQISDLRLELDSASTQRRELIETGTNEAVKLKGEILSLQILKTELEDRILILESKSNNREEELSAALNNLQLEVDSLNIQKSEYHKLSESLKHEIEAMNQKLVVLTEEKEALGIQIQESEKTTEDLQRTAADLSHKLEEAEKEKEALSAENSSALIRIEERQKIIDDLRAKADQFKGENGTLDKEIVEESKQLKERLEAKENESSALLKKYSDLESETLAERKGFETLVADLRRELDSANTESIQLREEIVSLKVLKTELEDQILVLTRKSNEREEELSAALTNLQLEMNSLSTQKSELEAKLQTKTEEAERLRDENSQLQLQQATLLEQISDLDISLKLKEEITQTEINAVKEQLGNLQHELSQSKDALRIAEENESMLLEKLQIFENEKSEETGKKRTKFSETEILQNKQKKLLSEISKLQEEKSNAEVTLRLLNRRLVVTEQSLNEREHNHRQAETIFHQERNSLLEKISKVTEEASSARRELRDLKECIAKSFTACTELEVAVESSLINQTSNEDRILKFTEEIQNAKKWVTEMNNENMKLQKTMGSLVEELDEKKKQETVLQKMVEILTVKVDREEKENEVISSKVEELEKNVREMKEITICREEEKREAIRQLCMWVDYRTENYDRLKQILSQISRKDQRSS